MNLMSHQRKNALNIVYAFIGSVKEKYVIANKGENNWEYEKNEIITDHNERFCCVEESTFFMFAFRRQREK